MFGDEVPAFIADKRAVDDVERVVTQGALCIVDMSHPVFSCADFPCYHKAQRGRGRSRILGIGKDFSGQLRIAVKAVHKAVLRGLLVHDGHPVF